VQQDTAWDCVNADDAMLSINRRLGLRIHREECNIGSAGYLGGIPDASIETIFVITEAPRHHACAALPTFAIISDQNRLNGDHDVHGRVVGEQHEMQAIHDGLER
jgi:hypothetical protein